MITALTYQLGRVSFVQQSPDHSSSILKLLSIWLNPMTLESICFDVSKKFNFQNRAVKDPRRVSTLQERVVSDSWLHQCHCCLSLTGLSERACFCLLLCWIVFGLYGATESPHHFSLLWVSLMAYICPIPLSLSLALALSLFRTADRSPTDRASERASAASNTTARHMLTVISSHLRAALFISQVNYAEFNCASYHVQHYHANRKLGWTSRSIKHFPFFYYVRVLKPAGFMAH